ncbi:ATP-binding protein [Azonexus sp. IMCC34842]|uniref:ATP-binding protein n=1 Tax=Azonexus sp. IMCC34842 TaxID=3420950 RepID=UPI003D12FD03
MSHNMSFSRFSLNSLKTRITLLTLIIFLLSIWSLALHSGVLLRKDMQSLLGDQQFSTVSLVATEINDELDRRLHALEDISTRITPDSPANVAAAQSKLESLSVFQELFSGGTFVTDTTGKVVAAVSKSVERRNISYLERDYVATPLKEGKATIGQPVIGKTLGRPILGIGVPIRTAGSKVIGALVGVIDLSRPNFLDRAERAQFGRSANYLIVAPRHRLIVAASDKKRVMEVLPVPTENSVIDRFFHGHEGSEVLVNSLGVEVLASVKGIPLAGWYAAVTLPTTAAFAPIMALQQRIFLATLFLTLLAGGLTWWVLGRQLAPLQATAKALGELSDRDQPLHALPATQQDEVNQVVGGFNRLVAELERRRQALKESEELYRTAFQTIPDPVSITDLAQGQYIEVNDSFTRVFGWSREEFIGRTSRELGIWHNWELRYPLVHAIQTNGHCENVECDFNTKDGKVITTLVSGTVINLGGKPCMLAVTHDITELRLADERMLLAERCARAGAWDWDIQTGKLSWSKGFFGLFGLDPATTPASFEVWLAALHPEDRGEAERRLTASLQERQPLFSEYRIVLPTGDIRWIYAYGDVSYDTSGKPLRMAGICLDATERKQLVLEKADLERLIAERKQAEIALLEAKAAADTASEAKSAFLANMSHEIRTPMNAIIGLTHLLRKQDCAPEHADKLNKISSAANHLLGIINDILDFSKIEAGKIQLEERDVDVRAIAINVASMLTEVVEAKGVELRTEFGEFSHRLRGDTTRLTQSLLNLASNAVKFTPTGSVTLRVLKIAETAETVAVRFEVIDTGIGISPELIPRLFSPFQQADEAITRNFGGTGLGLAITRRLAGLMGGEAGAESTPGVGSTFWFSASLARCNEIDVESAPATTENAEGILTRDFSGLRLLLVEDNLINQEIAQEILADVGIAVDVAEDGLVAVEMMERASRDSYALILMDMQMPRMGGVEATTQIRKLPVASGIPIIAMTANAFSEDRDRCLAVGMNDFVAKPVDPERLYATLLKWLRQPRPV